MRRHTLTATTVLAVAGLLVPAAVHAAGARTVTEGSAVAAKSVHAKKPVKKPAKPKRKVVPRFMFRFPGRGYGHGVGMSQYGAYGMALDGRTAAEIITTYYRGTTIATVPTTTVRVLLASGVKNPQVAASGTWSVTADGGTVPQVLDAGAAYTVKSTGADRLMLASADGRAVATRTGVLVLTPLDGGTLSLNGKSYRGVLRITPQGAGVTVINAVDLESYLLGVVPREVPASWGDRAPAVLEAQAIAARSYAIATKKTGAFDMYADERSQVYGGASGEDPRTTAAVQATAGQVATYGGRVATTFFFSTSGGITENAENVFSNPVPYLVSINDAKYDKLSPVHLWRGADILRFTDTRLGQLLGTKPVLTMKITKRGVSPRAMRVRITTRTGGVKIMTGAQVRSALGLRSSWFEVRRSIR